MSELEELNGIRFDHCGGDDPVARTAWPVFVKAMRGRLYGENETSDAWMWFLKGFRGALERETAFTGSELLDAAIDIQLVTEKGNDT